MFSAKVQTRPKHFIIKRLLQETYKTAIDNLTSRVLITCNKPYFEIFTDKYERNALLGY